MMQNCFPGMIINGDVLQNLLSVGEKFQGTKLKLVFNNKQDKELFNSLEFEQPFFIEYIDMNSIKGRKDGWKILNYYGTSKLPFIELQIDKDTVIPFYSERGSAINQLISYFNG